MMTFNKTTLVQEGAVISLPIPLDVPIELGNMKISKNITLLISST